MKTLLVVMQLWIQIINLDPQQCSQNNFLCHVFLQMWIKPKNKYI